MKAKKWLSSLFSASLAAALIVGSGCKSGGTPSDTITEEHSTQRESIPAPAPAPAPAPVAAKPAPAPAPRSGMIMYLPTGERATSAVSIEKKIPSQVVMGQEFDYQIIVCNLTANTLNNVVVTDTMSNGFGYVSSTPAGSRSGDMVRWVMPTLAPGACETITVRAKATSQGTITACATVTWDSALCVTTTVVQPNIILTKTAPAEVLQCDQIPIKITITNNGSGSAEGVKITDNLPAGMTVNGQSSVTLDAGTLAAGQSREFNLVAQASKGGKFDNTANATANPGLTAASNTTSTVVRKPVLTLTMECPQNRFIGREACMTITIKNTGDGVAKNARLDTTVEGAARINSATDNGVIAGNKVSWNLGDMAAGATKTLTVCATSGSSGTLRAVSSASAYCADAVTANCTTEYKGIPALLLEVVDTDDPVEVGNQTTYIITATNQGSAPATGIRITMTLPGSQTFVSAGGATAGTAAGQNITFAALPSIAVGGKAEWRVVVTANAEDMATPSIKMISAEPNATYDETENTNQYK